MAAAAWVGIPEVHVGRVRPQLWRVVLGVAAGVRHREPRVGRQLHQRQRHHSTNSVAQAAGPLIFGWSRRALSRRVDQFAGRRRGDAAQQYRRRQFARVVLTGVAARRVGLYGGAVLIAVAFSPKLVALLIAIPRPALVAYMLFTLSLLFVQGMSAVTREGLNGRRPLWWDFPSG